MTLVRRRVVNPAPAVLALVNGSRTKRGKNMATKRRRRSTKRRVRRVHAKKHNPVNPVPRRRRSVRRRRSTIYARRRHSSAHLTHRRRRVGRRRHHRNPFGGGGEVVDFAGAGIGLGLFTPLAARFIGPYLPFGQYNGPALTAISGWGLSKILEMFSFTRRFAKAARILGYSTAVIQVVQPLVGRAIAGVGGGGNGNGMGWTRRSGMGGIGVMTGVPPTGVLPPPPPPSRRAGMQGIGMRPGNYGR